jgi:hypothetical protein
MHSRNGRKTINFINYNPKCIHSYRNKTACSIKYKKCRGKSVCIYHYVTSDCKNYQDKEINERYKKMKEIIEKIKQLTKKDQQELLVKLAKLA